MNNPKPKSKFDWIKDKIPIQCKETMKYLISMRLMCFVCYSEHTDRVGIEISKYFYVDL